MDPGGVLKIFEGSSVDWARLIEPVEERRNTQTNLHNTDDDSCEADTLTQENFSNALGSRTDFTDKRVGLLTKG